MPWKDEPDVSLEKILWEMNEFKQISGPKLCRILADQGTNSGERYLFLGSGGFLHYNDKYFIVTNHHVVRSIPYDDRLNKIVVPIVDEGTSKAVLINQAEDIENDLAVFELPKSDLIRFKPKGFLEPCMIEIDPVSYLENSCNIAFIHGFPNSRSNIDHGKKTIVVETLPYATYAADYDGGMDLIKLSAPGEGIDQLRKDVELPEYYGMSGSFVYCRANGVIPFKGIGVLSRGLRDAAVMWVMPIKNVLDMIDTNFA